MESRRNILKKISLGGAALSLGAVAAIDDRFLSFLVPGQSSAAPWWLIDPMVKGSHVGNGWHIRNLGPIERGATVLSLVHRDGDKARVHICANRGNPQGIISTKIFDFLLMDGGDGSRPTDEYLGRSIMGIARQVRSREQDFLSRAEKIDLLKTHQQRLLDYEGEDLV